MPGTNDNVLPSTYLLKNVTKAHIDKTSLKHRHFNFLPTVEMSTPIALNAAWRDITLNVTREMLIIVDKFVSDGHTRSSLKIFVDEMIFAVKINRTGVVRFVFGGDDISKDVFLEQLDTYIYSAKNVCYKVCRIQKFTNPSIRELVSTVSKVLDDLEDDEQIVTEVCKIQTFTTMEIDKVSFSNFKGYHVYNSIINIIDIYDDIGAVNNDLLVNVLETRPALFEDMFMTISKKRITDEIRRILRTTESSQPCTAQVIRTNGRCVMNLDTPSTVLVNFKLTPGAIEDRYRYNNIKDYTFTEEILEAAWHPDRYRDWCLTRQEISRFASYHQ